MKEGFRQSMAWLHTWTGLLVGWLLFAIFCAGTSAYYQDEITLWMRPELHRAAAGPVPQEEAAARAVATLQQRAGHSPRWFINLPTEREPSVRAAWMAPRPPEGAPPLTGRRRFERAEFDPRTGAVLAAPRETRGGEFLYRLHFDLHYMPAIWGRWIVGFCAMFMLVAIATGIVTHRRIFKDFFTFRPKKGQRSWLDAHNATAVLALPYHLMITYTGLVTLMFMYMPWAPQAVYRGDEKAFFADVFPATAERDGKPAGVAAPLVPIAPLVAQARARWGGAPVGRITVNHPGDAKATVVLQRQAGRGLSSDQPVVRFDGATGALISAAGEDARPAAQTRGVMVGLHTAHFSSPLLRALFFVSGLAGCAMVATGLLLWAVKERQKYAKAVAKGGRAGFGVRLVDGLNIGAVAGMPLAIGAYFWSNRLLPVGLAERPQAEIACFFGAWALALAAGLAWPSRRMWQAVLYAGAALFAGIPLLDAATSDSPLGTTLRHGPAAVAAFDLVTLALGGCLGAAAWWVGRRKPAVRSARQRPAATTATGAVAVEAAR
jgi:uncharacterized iron-regulated membrane protein